MVRARSLASGLIALAGLIAAAPGSRALSAQVPAGAPAPAAAPTRFHVDPAGLRPGQFVYQTTLERDVSSTILGTRTVTVAQTTYAGAPAWLLLESRSGDRIGAADSLLTDLTLRPLHWSSVQGDARLALEFRNDSAFGGTSATFGGRRSIVAPIPAASLVTAAMLETALRLATLQTSWEDSSATVSITLGGVSVLPTRLSVIGEDQVHVPAGTFDCWVVSVHAGDEARGMYWVTKRDPIVVRSTLDVPMLGGAQLVSALTRISR